MDQVGEVASEDRLLHKLQFFCICNLWYCDVTCLHKFKKSNLPKLNLKSQGYDQDDLALASVAQIKKKKS